MQLVSNVKEVATRSYSFLINLGVAILSALGVLGQMWVLDKPWYDPTNLVALFTFLSSFSAAGLRLVDQGLASGEASDVS